MTHDYNCLFIHLLTWILLNIPKLTFSSQVELVVQNPPSNARDMRNMGSIPGLERPPWSSAWQSPSVFSPGKCYAQRTRWWLISIVWQRVRHDWNDLASMHTCTQTCLKKKKKKKRTKEKDFNTTCREPQITRYKYSVKKFLMLIGRRKSFLKADGT